MGAVELDHFIVPCRGEAAKAAQQLGELLGVPWAARGIGPFAPVYLNAGLTLDFMRSDDPFEIYHFCLRVDDTRFDAILGRLRDAGIAWRSTVRGPVDHAVDTQFGGRGLYWNEPEGHQWEMLTVSYARQPAPVIAGDIAPASPNELRLADETFEGGCACRHVRFRMTGRPLVVHCCHCRWCQRESGAAFALNAMIESDRVEVLGAAPEPVLAPSDSGLGQLVRRCPRCRVAVWSHYAGSGPAVAFVRVGTLDQPDRLPPDIHIFTASKQPWVVIPPGAPAFVEFYEREALWPAPSLERREALLPRIEAWQAGPRRWD